MPRRGPHSSPREMAKQGNHARVTGHAGVYGRMVRGFHKRALRMPAFNDSRVVSSRRPTSAPGTRDGGLDCSRWRSHCLETAGHLPTLSTRQPRVAQVRHNPCPADIDSVERPSAARVSPRRLAGPPDTDETSGPQVRAEHEVVGSKPGMRAGGRRCHGYGGIACGRSDVRWQLQDHQAHRRPDQQHLRSRLRGTRSLAGMAEDARIQQDLRTVLAEAGLSGVSDQLLQVLRTSSAFGRA